MPRKNRRKRTKKDRRKPTSIKQAVAGQQLGHHVALGGSAARVPESWPSARDARASSVETSRIPCVEAPQEAAVAPPASLAASDPMPVGEREEMAADRGRTPRDPRWSQTGRRWRGSLRRQDRAAWRDPAADRRSGGRARRRSVRSVEGWMLGQSARLMLPASAVQRSARIGAPVLVKWRVARSRIE